MDKDLEAKRKVCTILDDFLKQETIADLVDSYPIMKTDVTHFRLNVGNFDVQFNISNQDTKGITDNQTHAIGNLADFLAPTICSPAARYASSIHDSELRLFFKHTEYQINRYGLTGIEDWVKSMINKAEELLTNVPAFGTLTGITTGNITQARAYILAMSGFLGQAKVVQRNKNRALQKARAFMKEIFEEDFINLLEDADHFHATHPDLTKDLAAMMKIDDMPTEHTGINGFGHDVDGNAIIGGEIVNLDMPDRAPMTFDNLGFYHDSIFKWGTYRYKYMHPDYVDLIKTVTIGRGKKVVVNVVMERKA